MAHHRAISERNARPSSKIFLALRVDSIQTFLYDVIMTRKQTLEEFLARTPEQQAEANALLVAEGKRRALWVRSRLTPEQLAAVEALEADAGARLARTFCGPENSKGRCDTITLTPEQWEEWKSSRGKD